MFGVLTSSLESLLTYFQTQRNEKNKNLKDALSAILVAIKKTEIYIEKRAEIGSDREAEIELSMLWGLAAIKVKEFSPKLAAQLKYKESYWEDALNLSRREILQNGIALKQIKTEYIVLFEKLFPSK